MISCTSLIYQEEYFRPLARPESVLRYHPELESLAEL